MSRLLTDAADLANDTEPESRAEENGEVLAVYRYFTAAHIQRLNVQKLATTSVYTMYARITGQMEVRTF